MLERFVGDDETVERILATARDWYGRELRVENLLLTARLARRYWLMLLRLARRNGTQPRTAEA